jgi:error-prone DNA polymerase
MTALAAAGALRDFGLDRRAALWLAEAAPFCPHLEDIEPQIQWPQETSLERIQQDYRATGISLGTHPVRVMVEEHWCYKPKITELIMSTDLMSCAPGKLVTVFGMVLVRQSPPSAHGMVFITMEDEKGFFNLVFTPQCYQEYGPLLEIQAFLCVRGRLQRQGESHSLMVVEVFAPYVQRADILSLRQEQDSQGAFSPRGQKHAVGENGQEKAPLERYFDGEFPQGAELVVTRRYY